jgi:peroxiredoxin
MGVIAPGTPVPDLRLKTTGLEDFTRDDLAGRTSVLVFFPGAFSPVCTDQFQVYEEVADQLAEQGATLYGVSCDGPYALKAFREQTGVRFAMLSDFEPKGAVSRAFGAYFEPAGFSHRALVLVGPDLVVRWSHLADSPSDLPGANLIFDALATAGVEA